MPANESYEDSMLDIIGVDDVEILVVDGPNDTKVVTLNVRDNLGVRCRLRICRITGNVWVKDTSTVDIG